MKFHVDKKIPIFCLLAAGLEAIYVGTWSLLTIGAFIYTADFLKQKNEFHIAVAKSFVTLLLLLSITGLISRHTEIGIQYILVLILLVPYASKIYFDRCIVFKIKLNFRAEYLFALFGASVLLYLVTYSIARFGFIFPWVMNGDHRNHVNITRVVIKENGFSLHYAREIETVKDLESTVLPAFHLSGTTRMSKLETDSVVDKNCKLLNIENCYILGSSVFTTPGWVNPTLSIMALSIRTVEKSWRN
jgi:hypothetical protein